MSKERKSIVTPEFRACFPALFEPKKFEGSEKETYSVMMVFPKSADLSELKAAIKQAAVDKWGAGKIPQGLRNPIRDGAEKVEEWGEAFRDCYFIRASSQYQPTVIDRRKKEILDPNAVYGGCYGRAVIAPYAYDQMGNKGVAVGLDVFQFLRHGEKLGGNAAAVGMLDDLPDTGDTPSSDSGIDDIF